MSITDDLEIEALRIAAIVNGTRNESRDSILLEGAPSDKCRATLIRHGVKIASRPPTPSG